jgi:hypothetical protein
LQFYSQLYRPPRIISGNPVVIQIAAGGGVALVYTDNGSKRSRSIASYRDVTESNLEGDFTCGSANL